MMSSQVGFKPEQRQRYLDIQRRDILGENDEEPKVQSSRSFLNRKHIDIDEIIRTCSKKLSTDAADLRALYLRGSSYMKKRLHEVAIEDFNVVLDSEPEHVECRYQRGLALSKLGFHEMAIDDFSTALELKPDHVNAAFARATSYNTIGQFSRAIEDYNTALLQDGRDESRRRTHGPNSPLRPTTRHVQASNDSGWIENDATETTETIQRSSSFNNSALHDALEMSNGQSQSGYENGRRYEGSRSTQAPMSPLLDGGSSIPVAMQRKTIAAKNTSLSSSSLSSSSSSSNRKSQSRGATGESKAALTEAEKFHSLGYKLRRQGDFHGAIVEYSKAIKASPMHFKAYFNRGFAQDKLGDFNGAIEDYTKALQIEADNAFAYYNRGISFDRLQQYPAAYADFTRAIALQPDNADFYHNRAFCLRQMNQLADAVSDYSASLRLIPNHIKSLNNRAFCFERLGRYDAALEDYSHVIRLQPRHANAHINRAVVFDRMHRLEEAIEDLNEALSVLLTQQSNAQDQQAEDAGGETSALVATIVSRGKILHKLGRNREALADFSAVVEMRIEDPQIFLSRAMCLKALDRYDDAIADLSQSIKLDPNLSAAYTHRGYCYRKLANFERSVNDYSAAVRLQPSSIRALNNRAYSWAKLERYAEAAEDYSKVIEMDPTNAHAYHNRGISYDKLGFVDLAIADFTKVLELDSGPSMTLSEDQRRTFASSVGGIYSEAMAYELAMTPTPATVANAVDIRTKNGVNGNRSALNINTYTKTRTPASVGGSPSTGASLAKKSGAAGSIALSPPGGALPRAPNAPSRPPPPRPGHSHVTSSTPASSMQASPVKQQEKMHKYVPQHIKQHSHGYHNKLANQSIQERNSPMTTSAFLATLGVETKDRHFGDI